jgi:hypothetical protein
VLKGLSELYCLRLDVTIDSGDLTRSTKDDQALRRDLAT